MFASRYKKIGAKIVFYRKLKSMTQEKLADEVVLHRNIYRVLKTAAIRNAYRFQP